MDITLGQLMKIMHGHNIVQNHIMHQYTMEMGGTLAQARVQEAFQKSRLLIQVVQ